MTDELWTLAQLPDQVAALLEGNYQGQSSGRVGELPSARAIRWYTTIGLVDRPVTNRGRAVLYGRRHVLQLAAIKKLQAEGHSLAQVQERLVGASEQQLAEVVGVAVNADSAAARGAAAESPSQAPAAFWKRGEGRPLAETEHAAPAARRRPAPRERAAAAVDGDVPATATPRPAVRLGDSVTVLLEAASRMPDTDELAAIATAAAPLLDLLHRLGLTARMP